MNNKLYIGMVNGAFGIKGEVKIFTQSNLKEKIFSVGKKLIIDDKEYEIEKFREHKDNILVTFKDYDDINKIDELIHKEVFIERKELDLNDNEYLYIELLDLDIIENNISIGKVEELLLNKKTIFIKNGSLIIPICDKYIENVDIKEKKVYVKDIGELRIWR